MRRPHTANNDEDNSNKDKQRTARRDGPHPWAGAQGMATTPEDAERHLDRQLQRQQLDLDARQDTANVEGVRGGLAEIWRFS